MRGADSARMLLPPGRGRGSSVGSIVCYLTGLSHVDPVESGLSLGRFLNRELASVPDIDLDFPRDIREGLILRVHERYGPRRSGAGRRARHLPRARRDPRARQGARPAAAPTSRAWRRASDGWSAANVGEELAQLPGIAERAGDRRFRALGVAGARDRRAAAPPLPAPRRHDHLRPARCRPIVPLQPAAMEGRTICQWDKDSCGDAGFLKIDLLGLGMLSAVEECVDLAGRAGRATSTSRASRSTTPASTPRSRPPTPSACSRSSRAPRCRCCCARSRRTSTTWWSRWRWCGPGPIQGGAVHPYIQRRAGARGPTRTSRSRTTTRCWPRRWPRRSA